jgi:hypothetical protein
METITTYHIKLNMSVQKTEELPEISILLAFQILYLIWKNSSMGTGAEEDKRFFRRVKDV